MNLLKQDETRMNDVPSLLCNQRNYRQLPRALQLSRDDNSLFIKKSSWFYILTLVLWLGFLGYFGYEIYNNLAGLPNGIPNKVAICVVFTFNALIMVILWFTSIREFVFVIGYFFNRKKINLLVEKVRQTVVPENLKVLLLYCTCNDFVPDALEKSMRQDYANFETIILDDSKKEEYKKQIDEFAEKYNGLVTVVRRSDNVGFKAGNINNYLRNRAEPYDYFVVLDSDEVIPSDYISEALKYFYCLEKVGAVQARHVACNDQNVFMSTLSINIKSGGKTSQNMKQFYGQNLLAGHGMIISKEAYDTVGGFPHVVIEDVSFSVELIKAGYNIQYADNIECGEEYPIDYLAFKKRQCKFTQGNYEFIKNYNKKIRKSKIRWFQKFDIMLSMYNLPLIPIFSLLMIINLFTLGFLEYFSFFSTAMVISTALSIASPILADFFIHIKTRNFFKLIFYFILQMLVCGSLVLMMFSTVIKSIFGKKATFIITPKKSNKTSLWYAIKINWKELLFAAIIGTVSYFALDSVLPMLTVMICLVCTVPLTMLSNIRLKKLDC